MDAEPNSPVLGLVQGTVRIAAYSPRWPALFADESRALALALDGRLRAIEHIGSTAVPGMAAKPIIDIAVAVRTAADIDACTEPLRPLGYEYRGEYGLPGRHFFTKGDPHTHYLHVVAEGSPHWEVWLLFRDYLIGHPDAARQYAELKCALARRHRADREAYTRAKGDFICRALVLARTRRGVPPLSA